MTDTHPISDSTSLPAAEKKTTTLPVFDSTTAIGWIGAVAMAVSATTAILWLGLLLQLSSASAACVTLKRFSFVVRVTMLRYTDHTPVVAPEIPANLDAACCPGGAACPSASLSSCGDGLLCTRVGATDNYKCFLDFRPPKLCTDVLITSSTPLRQPTSGQRCRAMTTRFSLSTQSSEARWTFQESFDFNDVGVSGVDANVNTVILQLSLQPQGDDPVVAGMLMISPPQLLRLGFRFRFLNSSGSASNQAGH